LDPLIKSPLFRVDLKKLFFQTATNALNPNQIVVGVFPKGKTHFLVYRRPNVGKRKSPVLRQQPTVLTVRTPLRIPNTHSWHPYISESSKHPFMAPLHR
jgi:hypothetical protein